MATSAAEWPAWDKGSPAQQHDPRYESRKRWEISSRCILVAITSAHRGTIANMALTGDPNRPWPGKAGGD